MKTALTIAGSDSSGGAGIQADIKTMTANGVYAMSAITALTAQNTTGVTGITEVAPQFLEEQIEAVVTDMMPDAVKTGMVSSPALIEVIASCIKKFNLQKIVVDPVMVATSGARLISDDAVLTLKEKLLPLANLITPNIPEAEVLCGRKIAGAADMEEAARIIFERFGCAVLLKGGHSLNDANDYLYAGGGRNAVGAENAVGAVRHDSATAASVQGRWFYGKRIDNPNTHGTGCTLSSAIASNLAKGAPLEQAVRSAKNYLSGALSAMLDLGKGSGPMNHAFAIDGNF